MAEYSTSIKRKAKNAFAIIFVTGAFLVALIPLVSVLETTLVRGLARFDLSFFTQSMHGIVGAGGGALHAIVGTVLITAAATVIAVPVGVLTAIYLVEYAKPKTAQTMTLFIDVMSGIPSIVAGLFAYAVFALLLGPGAKLGISGALALAVLMTPTVVRASEEMFRLVPKELREAADGLGSPRWKTIVSVVIPHALGGIITGVILGIARIIGETAPLLIAAGFTANMNYNLFGERMQSLPVYVYTQISNQGNPAQAFEDRAWTAALVLIIIVLLLNIASKFINPKKRLKKKESKCYWLKRQ